MKQTRAWLLASILTLSTTLSSVVIAQEAPSVPTESTINSTHNESSTPTLPVMSIRADSNAPQASLLIGAAEVIRFSAPAGALMPAERVSIIKERLEKGLSSGKSARDIQPGIEGNHIVIRLGQDVLVTIDETTAEKAGISSRDLAFQWTNNLRNALGADAVSRDAVPSRGLSLIDSLRVTGQLAKGFASWYGPGFHGRKCANGERFNMNALTAAHRSLPLGSFVKVTNAKNGKSTVVKINDRGPFIGGRIIDLSKAAAAAVGMLSSGTAPVIVEVLKFQKP